MHFSFRHVRQQDAANSSRGLDPRHVHGRLLRPGRSKRVRPTARVGRRPSGKSRLRRTAPERAWEAWNTLVETPKPGRIENIAGDGRQREVIWGIPDQR